MGLQTLKASLHQGWQAEEIRYMNNAIGNMERELVNFLINTKVGGPPAESVVDKTKNVAKSAMKESKKLIGNIGKELDKIFW